jgi:hypothetical protein
MQKISISLMLLSLFYVQIFACMDNAFSTTEMVECTSKLTKEKEKKILSILGDDQTKIQEFQRWLKHRDLVCSKEYNPDGVTIGTRLNGTCL